MNITNVEQAQAAIHAITGFTPQQQTDCFASPPEVQDATMTTFRDIVAKRQMTKYEELRAALHEGAGVMQDLMPYAQFIATLVPVAAIL